MSIDWGDWRRLGQQRHFQVLVPRFRKRWEPLINEILLPILVNHSPLGKLIDVVLVHPLNLKELLVMEPLRPVSVAIVHYIVVHG